MQRGCSKPRAGICPCWDTEPRPSTPLEGVTETLSAIKDSHRWRMILLTKGEAEYHSLCREENCNPGNLLMVGNSFRSDIQPAVAAGCKAAYIPFRTIWRHEKAEEFEHPDIVRLGTFSNLLKILL